MYCDMAKAHTQAVLSLAMLLAWCACAFALDPSLDMSQYAHTAWKNRDGFVRGLISSIAQTPDGYLWLGTESGLYRFDGVHAVPWQAPGGQLLPIDSINGLLVGRDGTLWIGTYKGLASWKDGSLKTYPEVGGQAISALFQDREGSVWVGTAELESAGKLCTVGGDHLQCQGGGTFGSGIYSMYEDAKGNLWLGVEKGFWKWKPGPSEFINVPNGIGAISGFAEDDQGALLIASSTGIQRFVAGKVRPYSLPGFSQAFRPSRMLRDHDGGLWIGTAERGLVHLHQGTVEGFSEVEGLSGATVLSVLEDREGNIWAATTKGLDRFRDYAVPNISIRQGLSTGVPWSLLAANDGSVWIGTNVGLNRWKNGSISVFGTRASRADAGGKLNGSPPESLFEDCTGRIWVSTGREFGYLQNDRFIPIRDLRSGYVHDIVEAGRGHLWVANQQAGLFHLFDGRIMQQIPWAGLGHKDFAWVMVSSLSQKGIWIGFFEGGVAYYTEGGIEKTYSAAEGLGRGRVNHLRFEPGGALWVGTESGLSRIKDGRIVSLTSKNGLTCENVQWSVEDNDHSVWLKTSCGVERITQSDMDAWLADSGKVVKATVFDVSDGLPSRANASAYVQRVVKTAGGRIWFVAGDGVSVIDPHNLHENKLPPPVHIENITADDKMVEISNGMHLPTGIRHLDVDYTALSLVVSEKVRFRVKLEGQDKDWRELVNVRHVHYTNLPPQHYRFRVIACNNSGVWNEEGATLDFVIPPAWYQTNWFRALCVASFLAMLWGVYQLRMQQLRRQERKLREAIATIPTMAWIAGSDGIVQFVNRRWVDYTGLSEIPTPNDVRRAAIHPEDRDQIAKRWSASFASGEPFEEEIRLRRADGEYRWFLSRAVPLRDKRGKIVKWYGASTDIEDRKRAEQLQADLLHTNRVSMLGELAASISHELKQPIAATMTNARTSLRLLKREYPEVQEACEAIDRIVKDGARATDILDRLRSLYKKTPEQRELIDVNEIIREMVVMLQDEANQFAVSIRSDLAANLPKITADRVQVQQVLMNLMLNGIEAMQETGGVLTLKSQPEDGHVVVSVSDTGVGLPAEKAARIFDAFFTTKPQGSGMGLAISRSIIESHGGRLWATPNDVRGASFHFTLPTAAEGAEGAIGM